LRDALLANNTLYALQIDECDSTSEWIAIVLDGVARNPSIRKLCLQDCGSIKRLIEAFPSNTSLEYLGFENSTASSDCITALSNALLPGQSLHRLMKLSFSRCHISGAAELARALETNKGLEALSLFMTGFGGKAAKVLADALLHNTTLKTLHLFNCKVGSAGVIRLADLLKTKNSLEVLSLREINSISVDAKLCLVKALSYNTSLLNLDISWAGIRTGHQARHSTKMNRFRKEYLSRDRSLISHGLLPNIFARVSAKPSALFLFLQETRDMLFIAHENQ
jgi:hypothetical protein